MPGGHESPSGAFKPQTGLRSKCRVFSAARARRFRCAAAGRGLFSFGTKREPEKCQRFRRAGPTRKGLLAPFNPKEDGLHTKKLAASLNAFLCSAISRPLSRCGGSSPQGSGSALSVTFGDTLSPFCRCATSSPDRGKSFKGRGKKRSHHALGSHFGGAGAKRLRGFTPRRGAGSPLARCSHREPAAADAVCRYDSSREKTKKKSPQAFLFLQIKNNFSAMIVRAKRKQF